MPLTPIQTIIMILPIAFGTFLTRALPFILFPEGKKQPKIVSYLGKVLPPAMMGLLVVYCLKDVSFTDMNSLLPTAIATAVITLLHLWKRNVLLSIGIGTVIYMALVQLVFI